MTVTALSRPTGLMGLEGSSFQAISLNVTSFHAAELNQIYKACDVITAALKDYHTNTSGCRE